MATIESAHDKAKWLEHLRQHLENCCVAQPDHQTPYCHLMTFVEDRMTCQELIVDGDFYSAADLIFEHVPEVNILDHLELYGHS